MTIRQEFIARLPEKAFDWEHPLGRFLLSLEELRAHLAEHQLTEGWEQDVANMDEALTLGWKVIEEDGWDDGDWAGFWDFIRDNMRRWWD